MWIPTDLKMSQNYMSCARHCVQYCELASLGLFWLCSSYTMSAETHTITCLDRITRACAHIVICVDRTIHFDAFQCHRTTIIGPRVYILFDATTNHRVFWFLFLFCSLNKQHNRYNKRSTSNRKSMKPSASI